MSIKQVVVSFFADIVVGAVELIFSGAGGIQPSIGGGHAPTVVTVNGGGSGDEDRERLGAGSGMLTSLLLVLVFLPKGGGLWVLRSPPSTSLFPRFPFPFPI